MFKGFKRSIKSKIKKMSETYIIAEIGNNHNGQLSKAKALIDMAAKTGVNAVKFQSFRGEDIVTRHREVQMMLIIH